MKLVRISEDAIIDIDDVQFAIWDDTKQEARIEFKSTDTLIYTKDQKVIDAISGSEEHVIEYKDAESYRQDNNYSIIISNDNGGVKTIGTRSEVLSLLDQLKNDETLIIKRTKQKSPLRQ
jgi:hypothetical protein